MTGCAGPRPRKPIACPASFSILDSVFGEYKWTCGEIAPLLSFCFCVAGPRISLGRPRQLPPNSAALGDIPTLQEFNFERCVNSSGREPIRIP